jgi:hypothetical protein
MTHPQTVPVRAGQLLVGRGLNGSVLPTETT